IKRKAFAPVLGWLRSTEITYGNVRGWCHPHVQGVVWVPSSWCSRDYVKHERWVEIWSECLRVDYAAGA
ncbi:protein rep, partial [Escherichia coli]